MTAFREPSSDSAAAAAMPGAKSFFAAEHLAAVERWVLVFGAALILGSVLFSGPRGQVAALCGSGMSLLNARVIGALGRWASRGPALKNPDVARTRLGIVLGLFQLKLLVLAALIYLTLAYLPVAPLWLLFGLTLLPAAICARAIEYRPLRQSAAAGPAKTEKVL